MVAFVLASRLTCSAARSRSTLPKEIARCDCRNLVGFEFTGNSRRQVRWPPAPPNLIALQTRLISRPAEAEKSVRRAGREDNKGVSHADHARASQCTLSATIRGRM